MSNVSAVVVQDPVTAIGPYAVHQGWKGIREVVLAVDERVIPDHSAHVDQVVDARLDD